MPAFETPQPILATVEVTVGDLHIAAQDRTDTVVGVRPSDPSHEPDVRAADQTRVEMTSNGLLVKGPKQRALPLFGKPGSVDVTIDIHDKSGSMASSPQPLRDLKGDPGDGDEALARSRRRRQHDV